MPQAVVFGRSSLPLKLWRFHSQMIKDAVLGDPGTWGKWCEHHFSPTGSKEDNFSPCSVRDSLRSDSFLLELSQGDDSSQAGTPRAVHRNEVNVVDDTAGAPPLLGVQWGAPSL